MTPAQLTAAADALLAPPPAPPLSEEEARFKKECRRALYFDIPPDLRRLGAAVIFLSDLRMHELMSETAREMQEAHGLELDADPQRLDGARLECLHEGETNEFPLDERERARPVSVFLNDPLPDEA